MVAKGLDPIQEILVAQKISCFAATVFLIKEILSQAIQVVDRVGRLFIRQVLVGRNEIRPDNTDKIIVSGLNSRFAAFMINGREYWQKEHEENILKLLSHAGDCSVTDPFGIEFSPSSGLPTQAMGLRPTTILMHRPCFDLLARESYYTKLA